MEAITLYCLAVEKEEAGNEEEALETLQAVVDRWPDYADAAELRTQILSRSRPTDLSSLAVRVAEPRARESSTLGV